VATFFPAIPGPFKSAAHLFQGMSETVNPTTNNKNASMSRNVSSADDGADGRNNTPHVSKLVATYSMGAASIGD
jgi:hypothetical protein